MFTTLTTLALLATTGPAAADAELLRVADLDRAAAARVLDADQGVEVVAIIEPIYDEHGIIEPIYDEHGIIEPIYDEAGPIDPTFIIEPIYDEADALPLLWIAAEGLPETLRDSLEPDTDRVLALQSAPEADAAAR